jgi:hypothetical protein
MARSLPFSCFPALITHLSSYVAQDDSFAGTDAPIVKCRYQLAAAPCGAGHRGCPTLRLGRDGERHPCRRLRTDGGERSERAVMPPFGLGSLARDPPRPSRPGACACRSGRGGLGEHQSGRGVRDRLPERETLLPEWFHWVALGVVCENQGIRRPGARSRG